MTNSCPPITRIPPTETLRAELVYVNYGVPKDYETLAEHGIDVKGKIVIARYGGSWRGIKPKVAYEHGAIGCIIYSDPKNDGYYQGDVYPKGAYRSDEGVQRGSVADMPVYSGDPLTPFVGAVKDAKRVPIKDAETLMKIPVLPISYADALPLLKSMEGPVAPAAWRGALPITYHMGPGKTTVHLKLKFNWDIVPIHDVIAKIEGSEFPDEWIIRGNHQDAWVNGADDPISGQVAMMDEAKAIGVLVKDGWRPKRTIIYCAWDGEEPGLLGSTEWVETHADELKQKAAVYINSDSNGRGFLFVGGSHTLEHFINNVARDVTDPEKNISVYDRDIARIILHGSEKARNEARERKDMHIYAMGSGSDYTPFLQHLGIASMNLGYGGEDGGGSYHSIYDSYDHYIRFGDPNFEYGITLSKTAGRAVLRLADADLLPLNFNNFASTVGGYIDELIKLTDDMRKETAEFNKRLQEKDMEIVSDPTKTFVPPPAESPVPFLNFAPLQNSAAKLKNSAGRYEALHSVLVKNGKEISAEKLAELNEILIKTERDLTTEMGLPKRPWFRHQIYAPGLYTGYGVKTIPAVREAIEQRDWETASAQIINVSEVLDNFSAQVDRASDLIESVE